MKIRASKTVSDVSMVDLMPNRIEPNYCPVQAFKKYRDVMMAMPRDLPIFTVSVDRATGTPSFFTPRDLNNVLWTCLESVDRSKVQIGTHSFRR